MGGHAWLRGALRTRKERLRRTLIASHRNLTQSDVAYMQLLNTPRPTATAIERTVPFPIGYSGQHPQVAPPLQVPLVPFGTP